MTFLVVSFCLTVMKFKHPFTCLVSGPTQSGKTWFTVKFLTNLGEMVKPLPSRIIWCHGQDQHGLKLPDNVEVTDDLSIIDTIAGAEPTLLVLDDLMQEAAEDRRISNLFTKGSHHKDLSVIMLVQNIFHQGKFMRTISLNTHYMVLFKNPRDAGQIRHLASQLFPGNTKFLVDAYKQATDRPHGYLVLDFTQGTSEHLRVLSDVLPAEGGYYYVTK